MELELIVFPNKGPSYTIGVDVTDTTTSNDVLETIKDIAQAIGEDSQGKWTLHEKWMQMGIEFKSSKDYNVCHVYFYREEATKTNYDHAVNEGMGRQLG